MRFRAVAFALVLGVLPGCGGTPRGVVPPGEGALFVRNWLLPMYEDDLPLESELAAPVRLAATPGEYESASVGLRTNVPLKDARLMVSELAPAGGSARRSVPASAFEVRVTSYIASPREGPYARWQKEEGRVRLPAFLEPRDTEAEIPAGATRQFWLTLRVPDDAVPGLYRGTVTLTARGLAAPLTLPLEAEVYPFRLAEARPDLFMPNDNWPLSAESFAQSRAHGMNTVCVNPGHAKVAGVLQDGAWSFPGLADNVGAVLDLARAQGLARGRPAGVMLYQHLLRSAVAGLAAAGMKSPARPEGGYDDAADYWIFHGRDEQAENVGRFRGTYHPAPDPFALPEDAYARALYRGWVAGFRALDAAARERGWPRLWYWTTDEPHVHRGRFRSALMMARAARAAGSEILVTCSAPTVDGPETEGPVFPAVGVEPILRFGPDLLAIRCYHNAFLGPETRARTREAGARYGTYVNIYANQPAAVRLQSGYLVHKLGLDSVMFWEFTNVGTKPGPDGRRGVLRDLPAVREGIDDLRYLEALAAALKTGRGSAAARRAAEGLLAQIDAATPDNVRAAGFVDSVTGRYLRGRKPWPADRFDEFRRRVAAALKELS